MSEDDGSDGDEPRDPIEALGADSPEGDADGEDPFGWMDAGTDREGDPFDRLEGGPSKSPDASDVEPHVPREPGDGGVEESPAGAQDDPFDGFGDTDGDPFAEGQSVFAGVEVGDDEGVWERMDDTRGPAVQEVPGRRYVEVSKHSYCERCEHFSPPPEVDCSHEGTEILEFTDMETVRLIDCPIVEERRALEDE